MSDQFYSYLANKIIEFFTINPLTIGSKYNIQFEKEEEVRELYEKLKDNTLYRTYEYKDSNGIVKYNAYQLDFNGVQLIVSATIDDVQPDFLTRLRNMVGMEAGYETKAILFIHNTTLDSIMGGTESFAKEGMPFHIDSIQKDIKSGLESSSFTEVDKSIIEMDLDRKKNMLFQDNNSIFEYREVLDILNKGCINREQYKEFGLFYDSKLSEFEGKALKNRIKDNALYFNRVDEIHNYGNPESQLEKYFEEKGIEKLKVNEWKDVEYKYVEKSVSEKKEIKPLEYISASHEWDKEEGTSKAKSRIRNIIVFNESRAESVDLEFYFDDSLKKEYIYKKEGEVEASTSGKKLKVTIKDIEGKSNFYKVIYKDEKVKFEFKIVMLKCNEKYLEGIKSKFSLVIKKKEQYISVNTNDSSLTFNEFAEGNITNYEIDSNNDVIKIESDEKLTVKISENFEYENDSDLARFNLKIGNELVPIGMVGTTEKIAPIEGFKVWKLKREKNSDFKLVGENKLQHGTREYFTRDEFRRNLDLEKKLIELEGLSFIDTIDGIEVVNLELNNDVKKSYSNILEYYRVSKKLPSLTYLNDDIKSLYEVFISSYINALNNIEEGSYLSQSEKNLFKIGAIKREVEDRELIFTSLHPLNIAYQLHLVNCIDDETIADEVLKKFTSTYLLPYIVDENDKLYIPMEQQHTPEWKYYVDENLPRYKSSRDFVSKLVNEKLEEFVGHFKYMFEMGNNAPIRINLINTGDSKEILQGIFKYYVKQLKSSKSKEILPIDLFIYSNKNITNAFEEVAFNENINSLKEIYNLDLNIDHMSEEDVLNIYREKVHFYSKKLEEGIEYAHITFLEMNNEARKITSNMDDIPSGIILNGIISGVPSVFLGDSYRTGFGTKYTNTDNKVMNIATRLNAVNACSAGEPFNSNQCKAISVPNNSKTTLDKIYDASHWITFIDPKVDLNFFKNDPKAKDLLIIHYSDQYTTAGGYDAITVTRKSGPYQRVIEEFLTKKGVENAHDYSPAVINMFNAVNGDWLLRLLSSKSHFPKEKISILSAIKLALAEFKKDNVIWVPISLEEVLRVSGGAGLKQSEGFLSTKNLGFEGGASDDILLVGIEEIDNEVLVHYYPIEVKIGENNSTYIQKGIEQAKSTKKIFNETLLPDENGDLTSTQKVYRNFLMQLVITSAEKLNLYHVCDEENWVNVIDSDLRRKLLNEEYEISNSFEHSIGKAAVISFKKGVTFNDIRIEDEVMVIEMSEEEGINFITKSVKEIRELVDGVQIAGSKPSKPDESTNTPPSKNIGLDDEEKLTPPEIVTDEPETVIKPVQVVNDPIESYIPEDKNEERNMEILFGINEKNNKEVYWYPNDTDKVFHTNTGIIGTMGTGKTQFTKSMVTQIYRESKYNVDGKDVGILIFDYKGDYNKSKTDFIKATNANVYELYHLPFNPLSVIKAANSKPMLPLHTANSLKVTLAKAFGLGIKQETLLRDLIMEAYEKRGIVKNNADTWDKPAPTLKDVYDIYVNREDLKEDSLYAAFSNLIDFEIFEPDPDETKSLFELIDGVTVIDLSGYDPDIQNLVVAITLDLFYSQMQAYGHSGVKGSLRQLNKMILVDEADNFLSKDFETLKKILKEGREFGVGTILSTQLLSHFSTGENKYSDYILTWIVHNVAEINPKDAKYIFNAQAKADQEMICNKIKSLSKHYSLVKMGDNDRAIFMRDRAFWELVNNKR
ncbi:MULTISPECIES: DNA phosphorothioation-dependent restriction protein DptH [unclassified Clostridium]|uniref:DNA phosphorothioation-dependent restriction protein DptH n=1 Tax=Clostridium TaxID=1485 RepID=UPI001C8B7DEC|nr:MULTISPECIES: DNA phosphorothioation-dependent restriction protein DptH [unclassified Clostridium]MBX9138337.1 DNA phosphorothioation-dependent restriction protein DptH [Clostridium sp. K12(2020)]MBX9145053.1 DNA phosphorothioation-dependent restriction protein DptH [Clostridium sp. K13]